MDHFYEKKKKIGLVLSWLAALNISEIKLKYAIWGKVVLVLRKVA